MAVSKGGKAPRTRVVRAGKTPSGEGAGKSARELSKIAVVLERTLSRATEYV